MNETESFNDYLTVAQAAETLNISAQTLRRWDESGKLKAVRHPINGYRYYRPADLAPFKLEYRDCLLYTSPSPRDRTRSRMPSSA